MPGRRPLQDHRLIERVKLIGRHVDHESVALKPRVRPELPDWQSARAPLPGPVSELLEVLTQQVARIAARTQRERLETHRRKPTLIESTPEPQNGAPDVLSSLHLTKASQSRSKIRHLLVFFGGQVGVIRGHSGA